jgi:hypothetical protein
MTRSSFNEPLNTRECLEALKKRIVFVLPGEENMSRKKVYLEWIALCDAALAALDGEA